MTKMKNFAIGALLGTMIVGTAACVSAAGITADAAKKAALDSVGLTEQQVVFLPETQEFDDGRQIFDVDFLVPGEMKYEFDIDAVTGAIVEQDIELWEAEDDFEFAALLQGAGIESGATTVEAVAGEITELQARMIALKDTGFSADEVFFIRCKKDFDDGITKYEIEMRGADGLEYDYEINAADGKILERDADRD